VILFAEMTYKVSGAMVKGLTIATTEVAKRVAPYVRSCADSVLPSGGSDGKNETTDNVLAVAGAGLAGALNFLLSYDWSFDMSALLLRDVSQCCLSQSAHCQQSGRSLRASSS